VGTAGFLSVFEGESENPELFWDSELRGELRTGIGSVLDDVFRKREDEEGGVGGGKWNIEPGFSVKYAKLMDELFIGGVYVRLFLEEPTYNLRNPGGFLELLCKWWAEELELITGGGGGGEKVGEGKGGSQITTAKQDVLNLCTSAAVYLCKLRGPLCDKLAQWGTIQKAVTYVRAALGKGMIGTSLVSAVRLLHVASSRRANIEAIAHSANEFLGLMQQALCSMEVHSSGKKGLHQDAGFMVEILLKVFKDALGDVDNPFASAPAPALAAAVSEGFGGEGGAGGEGGGVVDARTAPYPALVALEKSKTHVGSPGKGGLRAGWSEDISLHSTTL
jgi:hypothetical protein